jgi:hypothetical protein
MSRTLAAAVAGIVAVTVTVVAAAPPASAAAQPCTGAGMRIFLRDGLLDDDLWLFFPAHHPDEKVYYSAAPAGYGYWSCSLVQGSVGNAVVYLQNGLNECYPGVIGTPLQVDGQFGPKTKAALVKVQQWHGIEANGQYGPQTARTIYHDYVDFRGYPSSCLTLSDFGWPGNSA